MKCIQCGAETEYFKWSIMGQIKIGLCDAHKHYEPYLSFGPQLFKNTSMGVMPPATLDGERNNLKQTSESYPASTRYGIIKRSNLTRQALNNG